MVNDAVVTWDRSEMKVKKLKKYHYSLGESIPGKECY